jgi:hypothetical protein
MLFLLQGMGVVNSTEEVRTFVERQSTKLSAADVPERRTKQRTPSQFKFDNRAIDLKNWILIRYLTLRQDGFLGSA